MKMLCIFIKTFRASACHLGSYGGSLELGRFTVSYLAPFPGGARRLPDSESVGTRDSGLPYSRVCPGLVSQVARADHPRTGGCGLSRLSSPFRQVSCSKLRLVKKVRNLVAPKLATFKFDVSISCPLVDIDRVRVLYAFLVLVLCRPLRWEWVSLVRGLV